ncbi:MAG TPA: hypothetical protein VGQ37_10100 [Vicinamibacterales bacterium]|jgi:hypothetical protein|nr:hypothetical protein [Vicinamibacterales bacterium]
MRTVCRPLVSNPGATLRIAMNVRIMSPALTSSTSASATCATTSPLRVRTRSRLSPAPRAPLSIPESRPAAYLNAGISPNRIPDRIDTRSANASARPSTVISCSRGSRPGSNAFSRRTPP